MSERLGPCRTELYQGMSYEAASREAQRVCRIAGVTGQTVLAHEHLSALVPVLMALAQKAVRKPYLGIAPAVITEGKTRKGGRNLDPTSAFARRPAPPSGSRAPA